MGKRPFPAGPRPQRPLAGPGKGSRPPRSEVADLIRQAGDALKQRNHVAAAHYATAAIELYPNNPQALHILGSVALAIGEPRSALTYLQRAVAANGSDPAVQVNLASALIQTENHVKAETHLRRALKLKPENPAALAFLAECRALTGHAEEAIRIYKDAIVRFPHAGQLLVGYAGLCVTLGEIEKAAALYRQALVHNLSPAIALAGLATCKRLDPASPEAKAIERLTRASGLRAIEHVALRHAAGDIAARAGRYSDAFRHYSEAKKLGREPFDLEADRRWFESLKAAFTPAFFAERKGFGDPSTRPLFVVGMPRSGTTLTEQIIASHPDAAGGDELRTIAQLATSLGYEGSNPDVFTKRVAAITPAESRKYAHDYLGVLSKVSATATRVTDKMPQNFLYLGLIALMFPNAKIVHCVRDPLDTCFSCFASTLKQRNHPYTADLATLGGYYREYFTLMDHWRSALPLPMFDLTYERLVADLEGEAKALIAFVGLPWDPACLAFHETVRSVQTVSRVQVRQQLYTTSVGRWRRYAEHLGPLKVALGDLAEPD